MTTLKETQETMQEWIDEIIFDLQQDWNDDKERMGTQLGLLIQAKANLDAIEKMGGQIFKSSIKLG